MQPDETTYLHTRAGQMADRAGLRRRDLLKLGATLPLAGGVASLVGSTPAAAAETVAATPIVKQLPPEWFVNYGTNAEMRWDSVSQFGYTVPNERFFVRDHTATPLIDKRSWRLRVHGSGLHGPDLELSYDQLRRMPQREVVTAIECAGNGRSFFASQQGTPASGTQWGLGAIGVARWRGVPLREVLKRARVSHRAVDVMPVGLDATVVSGGVDYGHVRRPLPIGKALDDAMLVLTMNGEDLPPDHGFPVRLVVPGWIGIASVKWLGEIEVSDQPLFSYWNTVQYVMTGDAYPDRPLLSTQTVKSAWELASGAALPARKPVTLTGRAWSGTSAIERVEVSADHGASWTRARLEGPRKAGTWTPFRHQFRSLERGPAELWARATDHRGRSQPLATPFNNNGYLYDAVIRHPVTVS